jgi:hypothetical protein
MTHEKLKLHEWIERGRTSGAIREISTVIWAYCMDEPQALRWIAAIVSGHIEEDAALANMDVELCVDEVLGDLDWSQMASSTPS